MSVTIPTPDCTRYVSATLHLCNEGDVLEWAEEHGVTVTYLPNEAEANLICATNYYPEGENLALSVVAQVQR